MPLTDATTPTTPTTPSRRALLGGGLAGGAALLGLLDQRTAHAAVVRTNPFALGVASGDPLPSSVILWTRLVGDAALPARDVPVAWEVAADSRFARRVARGTTTARAALGHSVHVDARGLAAGRDYWYRFKAAGYVSPAGRTRTAPAAGATVANLRLVTASCQDYQAGHWPALRGIAAEAVDVVVFLGDYIYEGDPNGSLEGRDHSTPQQLGNNQLTTLADYRARYEQYKRDPALQAAHARAPWITTWDDHEVKDNYAGLYGNADDGADAVSRARFARQRAAAYQAYYENLPIRATLRPGSASLTIYRRFDFGRLVRLNVLDTRQYRTPAPGGDGGLPALGARNTGGTMLGRNQLAWLTQGLTSSRATWNVLAQQVMFGAVRFPAPSGDTAALGCDLDSWDGYAPERAKILSTLSRRAVRNPVVLSGDYHSTWFNDVPLNPTDPKGKPLATEFLTTSISSDYSHADPDLLRSINPTVNPHTKYFQSERRGYLRMHVTPKRWLVEERTVESVSQPTAPVTTTAKFATQAGRPGIVKA